MSIRREIIRDLRRMMMSIASTRDACIRSLLPLSASAAHSVGQQSPLFSPSLLHSPQRTRHSHVERGDDTPIWSAHLTMNADSPSLHNDMSPPLFFEEGESDARQPAMFMWNLMATVGSLIVVTLVTSSTARSHISSLFSAFISKQD